MNTTAVESSQISKHLKGWELIYILFQVSHISKPGETISSHGFQQRMGGKGFNQAVAVSLAAGQDKVSFYGTIGDDESGRALKDKLWARWGLRNDTLFLDPVGQRGRGDTVCWAFFYFRRWKQPGGLSFRLLTMVKIVLVRKMWTCFRRKMTSTDRSSI